MRVYKEKRINQRSEKTSLKKQCDQAEIQWKKSKKREREKKW